MQEKQVTESRSELTGAQGVAHELQCQLLHIHTQARPLGRSAENMKLSGKRLELEIKKIKVWILSSSHFAQAYTEL